MTDEQNSTPRQTGGEHVAEEPAQTAEGAEIASDPTPAEQAELAAIDHSAWMRPAVGDTRRTAEVVDALAPEPPAPAEPDEPVAEPVATAPQQGAGASAEQPDQDLAPTQMAAVIGARAARAKDHVPGASLTHATDIPDLRGATAAAPRRSGLARVLPWLAAALVAALAVFGIVHAATRKDVVVVTETPTPTVSKPPVVQNSDLLTPADAARIQRVGGWAIASTADKLSPTLKLTCLNSSQGQPNPSQSKQRTLTTPQQVGLAVLHQVDNFATVADASKAYQMRAALLAGCNDVPTWIHSATAVTGVGDESTAITVTYQDQVSEFHTLVLTRSGTTLHALDITDKKATDADGVVKAMAAVVNRQCGRSGGSCARSPKSERSIPPVSGTPGWLIPSDLPRVTPGAGLWTGTDTANVTSQGTTCENMTLASVAGPTKREQRTYLMTQDNAAPQTYGIDEVVLTLASPKAAQDFARTLTSNLANCAKRQSTAKVSQPAAPARKVGGVRVSADTMLVEQSMGGAQTARYRTAVVVVEDRVIYLVNNPSASYDLGTPKFNEVALRAGERATQAE